MPWFRPPGSQQKLGVGRWGCQFPGFAFRNPLEMGFCSCVPQPSTEIQPFPPKSKFFACLGKFLKSSQLLRVLAITPKSHFCSWIFVGLPRTCLGCVY